MCAECKEGGVCRQPTKACHVASMQTKSSLLLGTRLTTLTGSLSALNVFYVREFFWRLFSIFLSSKYKAGIKLCIMIQSIGQCYSTVTENTACGITVCNFHQEHPSQGLWLFLHTLEKTGSFSTRFGKFLQSIFSSYFLDYKIWSCNIFNSLVSVHFCVFCHTFINYQDEKKRLSCGFLSELFTRIYPLRAKTVLG